MNSYQSTLRPLKPRPHQELAKIFGSLAHNLIACLKLSEQEIIQLRDKTKALAEKNAHTSLLLTIEQQELTRAESCITQLVQEIKKW